MPIHTSPTDSRRVTGHHEFCVFDDGTESYPLLSVQAGIPITQALTVAERIFECVGEFECESQQRGQNSPMNQWASRWLLTIAEALVVSARKGSIGTKLIP